MSEVVGWIVDGKAHCGNYAGKVDIYFEDLTEGKQQEVLDAFGLASPQEANWDDFPIIQLVPAFIDV